MFAIFPEIYNKIQTKNHEEISLLIKKYFDSESIHTYKVNIINIIKNIGIDLIFNPIADKSLGLITATDQNGKFDVKLFINTKYKFMHFEKEFLMAHLLGHFFYDIQPKLMETTWLNNGVNEVVSPLKRYLNTNHTNSKEYEDFIDEFAITLFLPKSLLILKNTDENKITVFNFINQLSQKLNIPHDVISKRIDTLLLNNTNTVQNKAFTAKSIHSFEISTTPAADVTLINRNIGSNLHSTKIPNFSSQLNNSANKPDPQRLLLKLRNIAKKIDTSV